MQTYVIFVDMTRQIYLVTLAHESRLLSSSQNILSIYTMTVPHAFMVSTSRSAKDLSRVTISGYSKNEVVTKMLDRIRVHDTEKANVWAAELVCSGLTDLVVHKLIVFVSSEIHINNPMLPLYVMRLCKTILSLCSSDLLRCRNSQSLRNTVCTLITLACLATKKPHALPKIGELDFELDYIKARIVSRSTSIADQVLKEDDPKDLTVSINELATHIVLKRRTARDKFGLLTREAGSLDPAYWLAWLLEWDKHMTSRRLKDVEYRCAARPEISGDAKTATDCVWVVWDLLLRLADSFDHQPTSNSILALHDLYKLGFTRGKKTERKCILLHAVKLLVGVDVDWERSVEGDRPRSLRAVAHINFIYEHIRKEANLWEHKYRKDKISQFIDTTIQSAAGGALDSNQTQTNMQHAIADALPSERVTRPALSREELIESAFQHRDQLYDPVDYSKLPPTPPVAVIAPAKPARKPPQPPADCVTLPVVCTEGIGCVYISQDQMSHRAAMSTREAALQAIENEEDLKEILLDKRANKQTRERKDDGCPPSSNVTSLDVRSMLID